MKIFYWQSPSGNFGDDLNEWIWDDLLPGWRGWDPERTLLGVGTILNRKNYPWGSKYLVCGSGAGFGQPPDVSNSDAWQISFVRGRRTAALLNVSPELAISDPAVVIPRIARFSSRGAARGTVFIPHCVSDASPLYDWKRICARAGVDYVSPRRDSHWVIRSISSATRVITESMHGAIIADAFRIPWRPVSLVANFNKFKWADWGEGLRLDFDIVSLPEPVRKRGLVRASCARLITRVRAQKADKWSVSSKSAFADVDLKRTGKEMALKIEELKGGDFYLSGDGVLACVQGNILDRLSAVGSTYGQC